MRGARCLALPHVPPARCVSIVELTSCVGHERQEGDAHLSMCWAKAGRIPEARARLCRLGRGLQAWARLAGRED